MRRRMNTKMTTWSCSLHQNWENINIAVILIDLLVKEAFRWYFVMTETLVMAQNYTLLQMANIYLHKYIDSIINRTSSWTLFIPIIIVHFLSIQKHGLLLIN